MSRPPLRRRKLWLAFGLWLPIVCFALDHRMFHVYGAWTSCIRWFVGLELALFAWYAWWPPKSEFVRGAMLAAFCVGAPFALLTGVLLLPASLLGLLMFIGLFGLVPWGTAVAYAGAAQGLWGAKEPRNLALQSAGALTALIALLVPPTLWRRHEVEVARAALEALSTEKGHARAVELLATLPSCDTHGLQLRIEYEGLLTGDLMRWIEWSWIDHLRYFLQFD